MESNNNNQKETKTTISDGLAIGGIVLTAASVVCIPLALGAITHPARRHYGQHDVGRLGIAVYGSAKVIRLHK